MNTKTKHWASITAGILSLAGYASAASLGSEKYTYDSSGNIIEKSIDGQVTQMTYDSSNRLAERQATGQSKETTAYDAAGRPIAMKEGIGQPTRSMSYGYGDKVLENKNHGTNTGFFYTAEGQLVGKKTDSGVATYAWDGNVLAADGAETFTNEAHSSGGVPVIDGENGVIVSDYLSNTLSNGTDKFTSTAFGEGLESGRFTGKPYVKELEGFVFLARNYQPTINRWSSSDPSGYPDGHNNYAYVNSDPLSKIDSLGLHSHDANIHINVSVTGSTNSANQSAGPVSVSGLSTFHTLISYDQMILRFETNHTNNGSSIPKITAHAEYTCDGSSITVRDPGGSTFQRGLAGVGHMGQSVDNNPVSGQNQINVTCHHGGNSANGSYVSGGTITVLGSGVGLTWSSAGGSDAVAFTTAIQVYCEN